MSQITITIKDKDTKQTRIINASDLKKCPKCILSAKHWIPRHKIEECGGQPEEETLQVVFHKKTPKVEPNLQGQLSQ